MSPAQRLLADALQLDAGQRGALALELMDSISPVDTRDDAAWIAEIEKRARRALSGEQPGVDFEEAMDQLERDLEL
jgi:hypothetical protein